MPRAVMQRATRHVWFVPPTPRGKQAAGRWGVTSLVRRSEDHTCPLSAPSFPPHAFYPVILQCFLRTTLQAKIIRCHFIHSHLTPSSSTKGCVVPGDVWGALHTLPVRSTWCDLDAVATFVRESTPTTRF